MFTLPSLTRYVATMQLLELQLYLYLLNLCKTLNRLKNIFFPPMQFCTVVFFEFYSRSCPFPISVPLQEKMVSANMPLLFSRSSSTGPREMPSTLCHCTASTRGTMWEHTTTTYQRLGLSACASYWRVSEISETHYSTRAGNDS